MPVSASFPSGHAASGFAFAAAVGRDEPWLGLVLRFLAAAVAYSRVHTGVHYPETPVAPGGHEVVFDSSCHHAPQNAPGE